MKSCLNNRSSGSVENGKTLRHEIVRWPPPIQVFLIIMLFMTIQIRGQEDVQQGFLLQQSIQPAASTRPNCFDYTVTQFDTDTFNDLGFTTALTLGPGYQCDVDIYTGIARFVYESGIVVQMFGFNSLGMAVTLGRIKNGQIVYWYDFEGAAQTRRFVLSNPTGMPLSFRVTIQRLPHMLEKRANILRNSFFALSLIILLLIIFF